MIEYGYRTEIHANENKTQFWVELIPIGYEFPTRQMFGPVSNLEDAKKKQIEIMDAARSVLFDGIEKALK